MKRIICLLLFLLLCLSLLPGAFAAEPEESNTASGQCGDKLSWKLEDSTLTISGTGSMKDFGDGADPAPWSDSSSDIQKVVIASGVTSIGKEAFNGCSNMTAITIPSSVTRIGAYALANTDSLTAVTLPSALKSLGESAFMFSGLTSVKIPSGVTEIPDNAFYGCFSLKSATIASGVTSIGSEAFYSCSALTDLTLPSTLKTIGEYAFHKCTELKSMAIPSSVTEIPEGLFYECSGLTSVTLPSGLKSIGGASFWKCSQLKNLSIPSTVTAIGGSAFYMCSALENVTIPSGVTVIESSVFFGCEALKSVSIPSGVTEIKDDAFRRCSALTSVTLPTGLKVIEGGAFGNCSSLTSVAIPAGVTTIGGYAFGDCAALTKVKIPAGATKLGSPEYGIGPWEDCSNLKTAGPSGSGCNIEFGWTDQIPTLAFNNSCLTKVTIPSGVKTIGNGAFRGSDDLKEVTIPSGAETIGNQAFYGCRGLTKLVIPASAVNFGTECLSSCENLKTAGPSGSGSNVEFGWTKKIPGGAFHHCDSLTNITVPAGVTEIGGGSFAYCENLVSAALPSGLTDIGQLAFYECGQLQTLTLPASLKTIGEQAFYHCGMLSGVTPPSGLTSIGAGAFKGCQGLADSQGRVIFKNILFDCNTGSSSLTVPEGVTKIDDEACMDCTALKTLSLPSSLRTVGRAAFSGCTSLSALTLPDGLKSIGKAAFYGCTALKSLKLPAGLTSMGEYAFSRCSSVTQLTLPEGLSIIANNAFQNMDALKSVTIPSTVKSVGASAFYWCNGLETLTVSEGVERFGNECFEYCASLTVLNLPESLISLGNYSFNGCFALSDVYYAGSKLQWEHVDLWHGNEDVENAAIHYAKESRLESPTVTVKLNTGGKPVLSWKAVQYADKYQVIRSTTGAKGSFTLLTTVTGTSCTNSSAEAGKTYYYQVRALTESGFKSAYSTPVKISLKAEAPDAPAVTGKLSSGKPKLTWSAVDGAAKYQIWRSTTGEAGSFKELTTVSATSWRNAQAGAGKSYWYKVKAVSADGTVSAFSNTVKLTARPAKPEVTGSLGAKGKPTLSWSAVTGAVKYQIWRSTTGKAGSFKSFATVTGTSWTNNKATAGKTYYYKVKAVNAEGTKSLFSPVVELTAAPKPAVPQPAGKLNSSGKPVISWPAAKGAVKYQVWRSTTGKSGSFKLVKTTTALKYTHTKAMAGKTYYYKIKAVSAEGLKSAFSEIVKVKAQARPEAPTVSGSLNAKGKPVLTWKAVPGAAEYKVYRSTAKDGTYKLIKTTTALKFTNSKATAGKTYYYKIKAVTAEGVISVYSSVVKLTVK